MSGGDRKGKAEAEVVDEGPTVTEECDEHLDEEEEFRYDPQSGIPVGSQFEPTDQQLLGFYLRWKAAGNVPPYHDFIPTVDLYVSGAEPWIIHPASGADASTPGYCHFSFPRDSCDWFYCYARTTPSTSRSCRRVGSGAWRANGKPTAIGGPRGEMLGYKTSFAFNLPRDTGGAARVSTGWIMHEFSLFRKKSGDGGEEELVLCRMKYTKRRAEAPARWKRGEGGRLTRA